uniref:Uncharacterized protein n=1 Tax=Anopheles minimus TaxID=112268 RepID=A0A182WP93_9DIPT
MCVNESFLIHFYHRTRLGKKAHTKSPIAVGGVCTFEMFESSYKHLTVCNISFVCG